MFDITKNWIILLQLDLKHIHKVNFYPSDNNFTQALLVMLVTNIISGCTIQSPSVNLSYIYGEGSQKVARTCIFKDYCCITAKQYAKLLSILNRPKSMHLCRAEYSENISSFRARWTTMALLVGLQVRQNEISADVETFPTFL